MKGFSLTTTQHYKLAKASATKLPDKAGDGSAVINSREKPFYGAKPQLVVKSVAKSVQLERLYSTV